MLNRLSMLLEDFNFNLPPHLIANRPLAKRDQCKLLFLNRSSKEIHPHSFFELPLLLSHGDCLVINQTSVIPAKIKAWDDKKEYDILLIKKIEPLVWNCLVKKPSKIKTPLKLEGNFSASIENKNKEIQISFSHGSEKIFNQWLEQYGKMPIPPYLSRPSDDKDKIDYQTIYACSPGSVAAPTAGLHFTEELLNKIKSKNIEILSISLHIGYGTFQPIQTSEISQHKMHKEIYSISDDVFKKLSNFKKEKRRIIAVGTTSLRALESIEYYGLNAETDLFIYPGFKFKWTDGLITNFHLPKSSLFILTCAFAETTFMKKSYELAIQKEYRFFSYGDAMLII